MFMTYSWSHPLFLSTLSLCWKISRLPSAEKYASALLPPKVIWRMLVRWCSPGSAGQNTPLRGEAGRRRGAAGQAANSSDGRKDQEPGANGGLGKVGTGIW